MPTTRVRDLICFSPGGGPNDACSGMPALGWRLWPVRGGDDVLQLLRQHPETCFAALLDLSTCAQLGGHELDRLAPMLVDARVAWVAAIAPGRTEEPWVRRLVRDYCHDYVTVPCSDALLAAVLGHAHGMACLLPEDTAQVPGAGGLEEMVGESPAMVTMVRDLRRAAATGAPVYIAGETGTGKELAAQALHRHSARRAMPFVVINCGAIPQGLVQSELFGFERGAFTGATQRKLGRIELAHRGTLFLDEIGDLPMDSQASLLRFLQQGSIERLGGHDEIRLDVRIVSATHVDLAAAVAAGRFREDLFHRLRVLELQLPPLRERGEDIALIARHALRRYAPEARRRIRGFSPCAIQAMHRYAWPGNVRELINRVRQAAIMADGAYLTARDLRLQDTDTCAPQTLEAARCVGERAAIERALQRNGHRLVHTARELGISRVTLYRLMSRHGLRDGEDRGAATHID